MISARILKVLAAGAVVVSAVAVCVISLALAVHAALLPLLGEAGTLGLIAAGFAILALVAAMVAVQKPEPRQASQSGASLIDILLNLVQAKPLMSTALAALIGLILSRNPDLLATLIRTFTTPPPPSSRED